MKKSKFTDSQIMDALKRAEVGVAVPEICRVLGVSTATFYNWRSKYGGMDVSLMARMKELEAENARLRKMYVEEKIKAEIVAEALAKKTEAIYPPRDGQRRSSEPGCVGPARMRGIWCKPDMLPLRAAAQCRERADCRLAATADRQSSQLGLWAVFPVPAQREGLRLEP